MGKERQLILVYEKQADLSLEVHLAELFPVEEFCARRESVVSKLPIFLDVELLPVDVIRRNTFRGGTMHLEHVDNLSNVKLTQLDHLLASLGVNFDAFVFRN